MLVIKKKQIVFVGLIVMIAVAGYLNWRYENDMETVPAGSEYIDITSGKNLGEAQKVDSTLEQQGMIDEQDQHVIVNADPASAYFIEARMDKESTRSEALEILGGIVDNENSPQETKTKAQNEMIEMAQNMDREVAMENLIKAKGFENVVAFINEGKVTIVVRSDGLIPSQVAQIQDIVVTQTDAPIDHIKIMEK